eukprot:SAG25_NODE_2862_length_1345_cov_5.800963_1_plen_423_part_01
MRSDVVVCMICRCVCGHKKSRGQVMDGVLLLATTLGWAAAQTIAKQQQPAPPPHHAWPANSWPFSLPTFANQTALEASTGWYRYLRAVYGMDTQFTFPIEVRQFNYFYRALLPHADRERLHRSPVYYGAASWGRHKPPSIGDVLTVYDTWFDPSMSATHRQTQPKDIPPIANVWIYMYDEPRTCGWGDTSVGNAPLALSDGFADNTLVEVTHSCCDDINNPNDNGYWMLLARGSGVFVDLGRTRVFTDHHEAFAFFGHPEIRNIGSYQNIVVPARAAGYDTIQFTHRCERLFKFEVLDVRAPAFPGEGRDNVCRHSHSSAAAHRSGWGGQKACECTETNMACLNCMVNGLPFPPCPDNRAGPALNECDKFDAPKMCDERLNSTNGGACLDSVGGFFCFNDENTKCPRGMHHAMGDASKRDIAV